MNTDIASLLIVLLFSELNINNFIKAIDISIYV